MDRDSMYVTSIPADARVKVTAKYGKIGPKRAEYYIGEERVGVREFFITGEPEVEWSWRNGQPHGWQYRWHEPGKLLSCEFYEDGRAHGTAYQWAHDGRMIGSYTMEHGTGLDLWWQDLEGDVTLSEAYQYRDGARNGYEWWFYDGRRLSIEKHWSNGVEHGIERQWNPGGGLCRGYPRYFVRGERVTRRQYLAACRTDTALPTVRPEDNAPHREFPPEVAAHLPPE